MPRKDVKLIDEHHEFVNAGPFSLSALVRQALDKAMAGERELPERTRRDTYGHDIHRTAVTIDEDHAAFINDNDFVFSVFVHDVIEDRIELERRLDEE